MSGARRGVGPVEITALLCLGLSVPVALLDLRFAVIPLLAGHPFLFASRRWTPREKATGSLVSTLLGLPALLGIAVVAFAAGASCPGPEPQDVLGAATCGGAVDAMFFGAALLTWGCVQAGMLAHLGWRARLAPAG